MKSFPGEIEKVGREHRRVLNDEQVEWLRKWFPVTETGRIAKAMGCGMGVLYAFVRQLGLSKSEKGLAAIRRRSGRKAAKTNEKNGCFDRKRGRPVSEATIAGVKRRFEEERAGLRENGIKRMRRENPEKYQDMLRKRSEARKEAIRKEKMRLIYGLPRKTALKAVVMCPYKMSQVHHRGSALKRGYILTEDCSEGNPDRYVIYYDKYTERSEKFEENCRNDGFKIQRWA